MNIINNFEKANPVGLPFTCDFNSFSSTGANSCNGLSYVTTNDATISSFDIDRLVGTSSYITDFTSIGKIFFIKFKYYKC